VRAGSRVLLFARLALGAGFLSAVADRIGMWGPPGATNVAWGDFARFEAYTARLNPYLPGSVIPAVAWGVTVAEVVVGVALVAGIQVRAAAFLAAVLLLGFSIGMAIGTGFKTALDASVPAAAAAAVMLAYWPDLRRTDRTPATAAPASRAEPL
jgi:uncharacterized membrane protein YphA (DoxX/SURF4 family)